MLHADHPDPLEITVPIGPDRPVVIAVADGIAGHPDGDRVARIAVEQLTRPSPPGERMTRLPSSPDAKKLMDHLMAAALCADVGDNVTFWHPAKPVDKFA